MKNTKHFSRLTVLFYTLLSINLIIFASMFAQDDPRTEVIIMFEAGIISLPEGKTEASVTETQISRPQIEEILLHHNVERVSKAFPNFTPSDTLGISPFTGEQVRLADLSNIFLLKVSDPAKAQNLINEISNIPGVIYAESNFVDIRSFGFPNDPHYENGDQWGLNNINDADIDAPEAWQITTGSNILIGVIDNGVDAGHEDLTNKVSGDGGVYGGNPNWVFGHGTHVAGIAAAIGNNSKGIAGVNWAATINSQRIENGDATHIYNSIMDAVNAGSKILNNSWGGNIYNSTIRGAFANAYKLNVISIAAMGNENSSNPLFPAAFGKGIIAVGATDESDNRSIWGGGQGSNYGNHIDIVAPGTGIWSSLPYTNQYDSWDGTSMATPFVSGIASLLLSFNPNLYNDDIEQIIRLSADDKGPVGWDIEYGTGRVNAYKAFKLISSPNALVRLGTYTGGTVVSISSSFNAYLQDVPGITGSYAVERVEVIRDIQYPFFMHPPVVAGLTFNGPQAWGNSTATPNAQTGLQPTSGSCQTCCNPGPVISGIPYTEVVPGTVTSTGCRLKTYLYKVYQLYQYIPNICSKTNFIGWFPTSPSNVKFYATVLGKPGGPFKEISGAMEITTDFSLEQNYPNSFNPVTQIGYSIKEDGLVNLTIYDVLGREISTLVNEEKAAGSYIINFDAGSLTSGIYFYSLKSGKFSQTKKMILAK